jgi:hypothetical protein
MAAWPSRSGSHDRSVAQDRAQVDRAADSCDRWQREVGVPTARPARTHCAVPHLRGVEHLRPDRHRTGRSPQARHLGPATYRSGTNPVRLPLDGVW